MFDHVKELAAEHAELELAIADPSVHSDPARARKLNRRYAELTPIVRAFEQWRRLGDDLTTARELASEDPSFRDEVVVLAADREAVEDRLRELLVPRDPDDDRDVIVEVKAGDTLDAIVSRTGSDKARIIEFNGLVDETVVIGQTLVVPGALGAGIATPTPKPTPKAVSKPRSSSSGSSSSGSSVRAPSSYSGGKLTFPVPGHRVSQYFHYGHYAIDIAGKKGDRVYAAAAGKVIYAGWKNNGGGNVVWIAHGSGLYTTYNHMSAVLVHTGQTVGRGQVVGRIGATGWATGPHLHFEVWKGGAPLWPDRRVNPMKYF